MGGEESQWTGILVVVAMGGQNVATAKGGHSALNTTFVTGNLQKVGDFLYHLLAGNMSHYTTEQRREVLLYVFIWLGYFFGAWIGSAVFSDFYDARTVNWDFTPVGIAVVFALAFQDLMFNKYDLERRDSLGTIRLPKGLHLRDALRLRGERCAKTL